jgi:hypothetical protein
MKFLSRRDRQTPVVHDHLEYSPRNSAREHTKNHHQNHLQRGSMQGAWEAVVPLISDSQRTDTHASY